MSPLGAAATAPAKSWTSQRKEEGVTMGPKSRRKRRHRIRLAVRVVVDAEWLPAVITTVVVTGFSGAAMLHGAGW
jgi:hypothetical protein